MHALRIRQHRNGVVLIQGDAAIANLAAEEAEEAAVALRVCAKSPMDGWHYEDGRIRIGKAEDRVALLVDGKLILAVPAHAALKIGSALRGSSKLAQHWEILSNTKPRERLYDDQQKLINGGLRNVNLGVPCGEMRTMGGISAGRSGKVGLPSVIATPTKPKAQSNGR